MHVPKRIWSVRWLDSLRVHLAMGMVILNLQEFTDGIKAEYFGRIILILKVLALAYRGSGQTKYAYELLYLIHNPEHVWLKPLSPPDNVQSSGKQLFMGMTADDCAMHQYAKAACDTDELNPHIRFLPNPSGSTAPVLISCAWPPALWSDS
ncbi:hypothetical protein OBBRIDRAFT_800945 [Obba rivulosa]|uniref:DUF6589 domain-containing protein n=1 Tax=Obba rivulosa TaxID=1052685 RepID=A0A8E2J5B7_9APHY|nr:hypothetical protein OBBRIDRAFT_800945 [Obba rivulosa]